MTQICNWPQNAVKQSSPNTFQLIVIFKKKDLDMFFFFFIFFFFHIKYQKRRTFRQVLISVTSSVKHARDNTDGVMLPVAANQPRGEGFVCQDITGYRP